MCEFIEIAFSGFWCYCGATLWIAIIAGAASLAIGSFGPLVVHAHATPRKDKA